MKHYPKNVNHPDCLLVKGSPIGDHIIEGRAVLIQLCKVSEHYNIVLADIIDALTETGLFSHDGLTFQVIDPPDSLDALR